MEPFFAIPLQPHFIGTECNLGTAGGGHFQSRLGDDQLSRLQFVAGELDFQRDVGAFNCEQSVEELPTAHIAHIGFTCWLRTTRTPLRQFVMVRAPQWNLEIAGQMRLHQVEVFEGQHVFIFQTRHAPRVIEVFIREGPAGGRIDAPFLRASVPPQHHFDAVDPSA